MLNKNTPGVQKSEAKSEAPISSYSYIQLNKKCDIWWRPTPALFAEVSHSYQRLSLTTSLIT